MLATCFVLNSLLDLMKNRLLLILVTAVFSSCSNADLQERMDRRNDAYSGLQERREIRQDARDARYDAWWDRAMD